MFRFELSLGEPLWNLQTVAGPVPLRETALLQYFIAISILRCVEVHDSTSTDLVRTLVRFFAHTSITWLLLRHSSSKSNQDPSTASHALLVTSIRTPQSAGCRRKLVLAIVFARHNRLLFAFASYRFDFIFSTVSPENARLYLSFAPFAKETLAIGAILTLVSWNKFCGCAIFFSPCSISAYPDLATTIFIVAAWEIFSGHAWSFRL